MLKCIRNGKFVVVVLNSGVILQSNECTDDIYEAIRNASDDYDVQILFADGMEEQLQEVQKCQKAIHGVEQSKLLTKVEDSVYWEGVSPLSMPIELINKVLEAEEKGLEDALEGYKNFWILCSLNPDDLCRANLFKWLVKWGMQITKSGLIVGYRNADRINSELFTDHHSHSFNIQLGHMVTMDRKKCDSDSHVSCSSGLHIGGTAWLEKGYFGDTGLVCLINPVDIVAVPFDNADYGKLRCCAYFPFAIAEFDNYGKVIPIKEPDGFEAEYARKIIYEGTMSKEDTPEYSIKLPELSINQKEIISQSLYDLAKSYMK